MSVATLLLLICILFPSIQILSLAKPSSSLMSRAISFDDSMLGSVVFIVSECRDPGPVGTKPRDGRRLFPSTALPQ